MGKRTEIVDVLKAPQIGATITVKGWVRAFRSNRFVALNDGSTFNTVQLVVDPDKIDEEIEVEVHVLFEDDKGNMVQIRGSPYKASFSKNAKPNDNLMAGPLMQANFKA